jgi:MFS family permease
VIYGCGSFTTAVAPNLPVLLFGWSFLEGVGAALILPAIVALVAGNLVTERRPAAYGMVAAAGAIAVAVGPSIGGFATTYFSWRWVVAGEVVLVIVILLFARRIADAPVETRPRLDVVGAVLSALGLGFLVFGVLRSAEWGWIQPKADGPSWAGLSPTVWLILGGLFVVWIFISDADLKAALAKANASSKSTDAAVAAYSDARIAGLRSALAILAVLSIVALFLAQRIPTRQPGAAPI